MNASLTIPEIAVRISEEMVRLRYQPSTIRLFRTYYDHFVLYANKVGADDITEELITQYFIDEFGVNRNEYKQFELKHIKPRLCALNKVEDFVIFGNFQARYGLIRYGSNWEVTDYELIKKYLDKVRPLTEFNSCRDSRKRRLKHFYEFLGFNNIFSILNVTKNIIYEYLLSLQGLSQGTIYNYINELRKYGNFLYKEGLIQLAIDPLLPRVKVKGNLNVPAIWSQDETSKLLNNIDRGNPCGKRDYAILLLVSQLGLRGSDIIALRLSYLDWDRRLLEFPQQKTGKIVTLPLLDDVGWAIIDYIQNGRPKVENPYLFISGNVPYQQFKSSNSISAILRKRMQDSGIRSEATQNYTTKAVHSLRHALARRLVAQKTPLSTIMNIMGHSSHEGTSPYLRIDIEGLRDCALSLTEKPDEKTT